MKKILYFLFILLGLPIFAQETIQISWEASTDNVGVAGYNVWVDEILEGTTTDLFYELQLNPGTYSITVTAFDAAGNESDYSIPLVIRSKDIISPTIPTNLKMTIYPNPSLGQFRLLLEGDEINSNILARIYNVNGRIIYERMLPDKINTPYEEQFNLDIEDGLYVLALLKNNERLAQTKLIISKTNKYNSFSL